MCVTFFCFRPSTNKKGNIECILTFNRDEAQQRQTLPFGPFDQDKNIFAGKDIISGGTWLGINIVTGIMVILTNYDLDKERYGFSRGQLVHSFLQTQFVEGTSNDEEVCLKIDKKLSQTAQLGPKYSPFNLIIYHIRSAKSFYICSQQNMKGPEILSQGYLYALSNADLHTEWPKTKHGLKMFEKILSNIDEINQDDLFGMLEEMMKDKTTFDEDPESQSSIYIQPYYSKYYQCLRRTKTTFLALFTQAEKGVELHVKQITYHPEQQSVVNYDFMFE